MRERPFPGITAEPDTMGDAVRRMIRAVPDGSLPKPGIPSKLISGMTTTTIQVRGRGTLTLPASLREKYRLGEGDPLTVVDLDGAVLLSPRVLVVPRLAAEWNASVERES